MLWKLFRPKSIVVVDVPFEGIFDDDLMKYSKNIIQKFEKDYHVILKFTHVDKMTPTDEVKVKIYHE